MPPADPTPKQYPSLGLARVQDPEHENFVDFMHACGDNDVVLALQLTIEQEPAAMTAGLNHSIHLRYLELARQLVLRGAQWDSRTVTYASSSLDAIQLLVDSGLDVNSTLRGAGTLLQQAVLRNHEQGIRFVLEHRATIEPEAEKRPVPNWKAILNTAAERCTSDTFALLLEHGADLSRADPLHHAAGVPSNHPPGERIPMLEYLGGLGLDVNAIADTNRPIGLRGTPLQYAISQGRIIEAKWLLENGADPDKVAWGRSSRDLVNRNYYAGHEMRTVLRDFDSSMSNLHSAHKH